MFTFGAAVSLTAALIQTIPCELKLETADFRSWQCAPHPRNEDGSKLQISALGNVLPLPKFRVDPDYRLHWVMSPRKNHIGSRSPSKSPSPKHYIFLFKLNLDLYNNHYKNTIIAVYIDSYVMMSSDLYGTCSYCFYGTCPIVSWRSACQRRIARSLSNLLGYTVVYRRHIYSRL